MKKNIAILTLLFCTALSQADPSPGTVGFQFLKTQVGARPAAMGGAFVAIPGDINAIQYNPAGIVTFNKRTASFSYLNDLLDINMGFVGFVQPKVGPGNLGIAVLFKDYGNLIKTDITGEEMGNFSSNSFSFAAAYAIEPYKNLYVGASGKYIRFGIDNYFADALVVDGGVMYTIPSLALTLAAGVFNVGQAMSAFVETKDDLPTNVKVGFSKALAHLPLLLSFNLYKYNDEDWYGALGGEFTLSPNLFLRLGYDQFGRDLQVDSSNDKFAGAAVGLGLLWNNIRVDYAFTTYGELGALNRFSVSGQF